MKAWQRHYHERKPVMGAPDDTPDGHAAAEASARLRVAREALLAYEEQPETLAMFLDRLREALR